MRNNWIVATISCERNGEPKKSRWNYEQQQRKTKNKCTYHTSNDSSKLIYSSVIITILIIIIEYNNLMPFRKTKATCIVPAQELFTLIWIKQNNRFCELVCYIAASHSTITIQSRKTKSFSVMDLSQNPKETFVIHQTIKLYRKKCEHNQIDQSKLRFKWLWSHHKTHIKNEEEEDGNSAKIVFIIREINFRS